MALPVRVYLDTCCVQRLMDDQGQERIREETEAIQTILAEHDQRLLSVLSSRMVLIEILKDPVQNRRLAALTLTRGFEHIEAFPDKLDVANIFDAGLDPSDAVHIASAVVG